MIFFVEKTQSNKIENQFGQITSSDWKQIEKEKNVFQKVYDYVK